MVNFVRKEKCIGCFVYCTGKGVYIHRLVWQSAGGSAVIVAHAQGSRLARRLRELAAQIDQGECVSEGGVFDGRDGVADTDPSAFSFNREFLLAGARQARPALPDPRLLREILKLRRLRSDYFEGDIFADPAWDMILDLAAAREEYQRVSVTSLCLASNVPTTTALRWINILIKCGIFERSDDQTDKRRAFLTLSDDGANAVARYFAHCDRGSGMFI